jgi:hypothetical protein
MEKKFIDYLVERTKREFNCSNFNDTELIESTLNFFKLCAKFTNNNPDDMKKFVDILHLLIDDIPITPITENNFVEEIYKEGENPEYKFWRCTRYKYLYKTIDGKYWDDRAIAFVYKDDLNTVFYTYGNKLNSKQQVTLPYYPTQRLEYIDRE